MSGAALRRVVRVEEEEVAALLWSLAVFFLLLMSYFVLRPLRDEMGIAAGREHLNWLFVATLLGTLLANPVLSALVARHPRRVFIPAVHHFFAANLVLFYLLLAAPLPGAWVWVARAFYVWTSVFNLFVVSLFWGLMADLFRSDQGKRLFGFIGLGGTVGGIAGSALTALLAPRTGPVPLLLLAAVLLEGSTLAARRLIRRSGDGAGALTPDPGRAAPTSRDLWEGMRRVAASPYLLGVCIYILLYTLSSTLIYFQQITVVAATFPDQGERTAFFGWIEASVQALTALLQLLLTGRVISRLGVGGTLTLLPALTLLGFGALVLLPVPGLLFAFHVTRRATEFGLVKPAREVLYTVVGRAEKYASKNFIDTFVYRAGDVLGSGLDAALRAGGVGMAGMALGLVPVSAAWVALGLRLGGRQEELAAGKAARGGALLPGP